MHYLNYKGNKNIRKDIEPLFISAFPEDERPPVDIYFHGFDVRNETILYGFYEEGEFIGFASIVLYKDICYIFFLAVSEKHRNQGYGTKILDFIKDKYKDCVILLCYEEVDKKYPDYENRLRRSHFYQENGFIINPLKTYEFGVIFQTVFYGSHEVSFDDYKHIFMSGFGFKDDAFLHKNLKEVK